MILTHLERLANEGFTDTAIEAAINTIEFSLRENNTGGGAWSGEQCRRMC